MSTVSSNFLNKIVHNIAAYYTRLVFGICSTAWQGVQTGLQTCSGGTTDKNLIVIAQTDGLDTSMWAYRINSNTITYMYKDDHSFSLDRFKAELDGLLASEGITSVCNVAWLPAMHKESTFFGNPV